MASGAKLGLTGILALIVLLVAIWDKKNEELRHRRNGEAVSAQAHDAPATVEVAPVEPQVLAARSSEPGEETLLEARVRTQAPAAAPTPLQASPVSPEDGPSNPPATIAPPEPTPAPAPSPTPAAASPAASPPVPAPTRTLTHSVGQRETLYGLAQRYLGNGSHWPKLFEANREVLSSPEALRPGMVLKIPGASTPAPAATIAAAPAPHQPATLSDTYIVQAGDTLSSISREVLGSVGHWKRLFEANRDNLQSPEMLREGQQLRIPKPE